MAYHPSADIWTGGENKWYSGKQWFCCMLYPSDLMMKQSAWEDSLPHIDLGLSFSEMCSDGDSERVAVLRFRFQFAILCIAGYKYASIYLINVSSAHSHLFTYWIVKERYNQTEQRIVPTPFFLESHIPARSYKSVCVSLIHLWLNFEQEILTACQSHGLSGNVSLTDSLEGEKFIVRNKLGLTDQFTWNVCDAVIKALLVTTLSHLHFGDI